MNRHLHSPTKLTEFAREFEELPDTFFGKFVNRLTSAYNNSYNSVNDIQAGSGGGSTTVFLGGGSTDVSPTLSELRPPSLAGVVGEANQEAFVTRDAPPLSSPGAEGDSMAGSVSTEGSSSGDKYEEPMRNHGQNRTTYGVMRRLSSLMSTKNNNMTSYKDTEFQTFWMPDSKSKECYECSAKFTAFRRKHHCRLCGQIFCSKCCNQLVPGKIIKCTGDLKVCTYCAKIVLSYIKSSDINSDLKLDLEAFKDDLSVKLSSFENPHQTTESVASLVHRKVSVGYQEERLVSVPKGFSNVDRKSILQQSNSLKILHDEMTKALPYQNQGHDLIAYLITSQNAVTSVQAVPILNALIEAGFLIPLYAPTQSSDDEVVMYFNEQCSYKLMRIDDVMSHSGTFTLDVDLEASSVHLTRPTTENSSISETSDYIPPNTQDNSFGFSTSKDFEIQNSLLSTAGSKSLMEAFCEHEELLLSQILSSESLADTWSKVLLPICAEIANSFIPSQCGNMEVEGRNLMDIRNFVNFKKVPGGQRNESKIVGGVGFTKNVVHKDMACLVDKPKVLLLKCAIVFQRVESKFVTLDNVLRQEKEHLRNVTARILSLKPNVVLVHKNVAGIAQEMLRSNGITLVLDVKLSVLERLSRTLKCDIIDSIDSNIGRPKLGTCNRFFTKNFADEHGCPKTLMFFEIQSFQRGCCVLLRGGTHSELVKVKRVARLLLFARYNWRLELSLLLDEFARPPSPKPSIFDSKDQSPVKSDDCESSLGEEQSVPVTVEKKPAPHSVLKPDKKSVEEKTVNIENVQDFSDPLRATDLSPSVFDPESSVEFAVEMPYDNRFKTALNSTVLSISPFVTFPLPYLETEHGRKCKLRSFYPKELYFSKQWSDVPEKANTETLTNPIETEVTLNPIHDFLTYKITTPIDNKHLQTLLASYRASGGRLPKTNSMKTIVKKSTTTNALSELTTTKQAEDDMAGHDALDIYNHQRLPVLFCSFYSNTKATSSFCVHPSLLNMNFYGEYDIMLGNFLECYCFRRSCPTCNLPSFNHQRRYVHSMGCIQVKLSEDLSTQNSDHIVMTSWCSICQELTPSIPMSSDTWCLSFGKYLEHRFHSHAYKRRIIDIAAEPQNNTNDMQSKESEMAHQQCSHSMHRDHVQYFSFNGIVATFAYSPIQCWEIGLPSMILTLDRPRITDQETNDRYRAETKSFSQTGYDVFAKIYDRLAGFSSDGDFPMLAPLKTTLNRDQLAFQEKVAHVHSLLAETTTSVTDVQESILVVKKLLADSIEVWNVNLHDAAVQSRSHTSVRPEVVAVDAGTICTEDLRPDSPGSSDLMPFTGESGEDTTATRRTSSHSETIDKSSNDSSPVKQLAEPFVPTKDVTDKKMLKTLLRELLPTDKISVHQIQSPLPLNEHHTLTTGQFALLVNDQDPSSVIGYSLVSSNYKKTLDSLQPGSDAANNPSGNNPSPSIPKKSHDNESGHEDRENTAKEPSDKKNKSHIEVVFQDSTTQFACKIYFAREFDMMRCNLIRNAPPHSPNTDKALPKESEPSGSDRKASGHSLHVRIGSDAKEFAQKQLQEIDDVRHMFARSLGSSAQWEARGGKSGSKFCKTLDDRFVLKEMSKMDVTIFENFAPKYFEYIQQCVQRSEITLLAKIFGVFRVTIKKKDSTHEKTLLVMENLFYNSCITKKYDLKGSERNRMVDPTGFHGEHVWLDENLIQDSWSEPLYILSHSKTILRNALLRDASFLERNEVMDYSLLVGLNSNDKLLVLGIIDYIRTFTLDKRIESLVKKTPFLGGQGKLPTVISPKLYKQRFTEAMERYFLSVPDRWEGFAKMS